MVVLCSPVEAEDDQIPVEEEEDVVDEPESYAK